MPVVSVSSSNRAGIPRFPVRGGPLVHREAVIRSFGIAVLSAACFVSVHPVFADPLQVDPAASLVSVTFRQMNVPVDAEFKTFDAQATFDKTAPGSASARITIQTASFDFGPGAEDYNAEVRKPEWFATQQFPTAVFEATGVKPLDGNRYEANGSLTIKGVTRPVEAPFTIDESGGRTVFSGQVPIKRLEFGIGANEWKDTSIVADEVIVKFRIVANRQ